VLQVLYDHDRAGDQPDCHHRVVVRACAGQPAVGNPNAARSKDAGEPA
jgi:hypothetical protein